MDGAYGMQRFSPHAWGCTAYDATMVVVNAVFPTRVGVYRGETMPVYVYRCVFPTRVGVYR